MLKGNLKSLSFPRLLCQLWQDKASGKLTLNLRLVEKVFSLRKGSIIHGESNILHETLGHSLVRSGLISEEQRVEATHICAETGQRIGDVAVQKGWIDPMRLFDEMKTNLTERMVDCFLWSEGSYVFEEEIGRNPNVLALNVDPFNVLIKGINTAMPFERMREDISLILNKPTRVAHSKLPPWAEGYLNTMSIKLLQAFHEPKKPRFVMQELGIEEEVMLRIVYAFDVTGLIINTEEPLNESDDIVPVFNESIDETVEISAAELAQAAQASSGSQSAEHAKIAEEVVALNLKLDQMNPFEILGVDFDTTPPRVQIAYLDKLRNFNLCAFDRGELSTHRDQAETVALALADSYAKLHDAESIRATKDEIKKRKREKEESTKKKPGAAFTIKTKLLDAGTQFQDGLKHLEKRDFKKAIQFFEYACDIDGRDPLYSSYLGWALYQADSEDNMVKASELIEKAVKVGAENAKVNLIMGKWLHAQGESKRAIGFLKKAAKLAPKDIEIERTLRLTQNEIK